MYKTYRWRHSHGAGADARCLSTAWLFPKSHYKAHKHRQRKVGACWVKVVHITNQVKFIFKKIWLEPWNIMQRNVKCLCEKLYHLSFCIEAVPWLHLCLERFLWWHCGIEIRRGSEWKLGDHSETITITQERDKLSIALWWFILLKISSA